MFILKKSQIILINAITWFHYTLLLLTETRAYAFRQRSVRFSLCYQRKTRKTITLKKQRQHHASLSYSLNDRPESGGVSTRFSAPKTVKCVASEAGAASFWAFSGLFCSPPRLRLLFLLSAFGSSATASFHKMFSVPPSTVRRRRRGSAGGQRGDEMRPRPTCIFFFLPLSELSQTVGGGHMQLKGRLKRFRKCDNAVWWPNVLQ